MRNAAIVLLAVGSIELAFLGCSSDDAAPSASGSNELDAAGAGADASGEDVMTADGGSPPDSGASPSSATFTYTPAWKGVVKVEVVGGFGLATDWTQPLATLTDDGSGNFSTTVSLPPGDYLYLFKVTGDEASKAPGSFVRYALDPSNSGFSACPAASPTYSAAVANPCARLSMPQAPPASRFHVKGKVANGSGHAAGYLVVLERAEDKSHHFFVNRVTATSTGDFDLTAAPGSYRLQVLHPSFYEKTDSQRDPIELAAMRRLISTSVDLTGDVTMDGADVAYGGYAEMTPQADASAPAPPTSFHFTLAPGATSARLAIYGPGSTVGDPWFLSAPTDAGTMSFDGGFNTAQATDAGIGDGIRYFWGTEQQFPKTDASVGWTGQTMVFPIEWQ